MRKRRRITVIDPHSESERLATELQQAITLPPTESGRVAIPLPLVERLLRFLRPFGDISLAEFGRLTPTEEALLAALLRHSPRLVSLAKLQQALQSDGFDLSQQSLMVHKRRLFLRLMENNEQIRQHNAMLPEGSQRAYTYVIGRAGSGYGVVRHPQFFNEVDLKEVNLGVRSL